MPPGNPSMSSEPLPLQPRFESFSEGNSNPLRLHLSPFLLIQISNCLLNKNLCRKKEREKQSNSFTKFPNLIPNSTTIGIRNQPQRETQKRKTIKSFYHSTPTAQIHSLNSSKICLKSAESRSTQRRESIGSQ